ncbi:hypothetical protein [Marinomonas sp. 2405UD68-3]|uniref:hypothetical protein n=1 Tax=Marinomonas sp. 2405UD68-3 TaxID=3391835 RepID=UPI0039C99AF9
MSTIKPSSRKNTCTTSPTVFAVQPRELHKIEMKCFYNKKHTREIHAGMFIAYSTDYVIRNTTGHLLKASPLGPVTTIKQTQLSVVSDFLYDGKRLSIESILNIKLR